MAEGDLFRLLMDSKRPLATEKKPGGILGSLMQTWPARAMGGIVDSLKLPGQVAGGILAIQPSNPGMWSDVDEARAQATHQTMINRSADLAGLLMGGTYGSAPAGALGVGPVYRRTKGPHPDTGTGHMMFADSLDKIGSGYGKNTWTANLDNLPKGALIDASDAKFRRAAYRALRSENDRVDTRNLVNEANPKRIVDSAGMWDDLASTQTIWEKVLGPRGILAVRTHDGAVLFDPSFVKPYRP